MICGETSNADAARTRSSVDYIRLFGVSIALPAEVTDTMTESGWGRAGIWYVATRKVSRSSCKRNE